MICKFCKKEISKNENIKLSGRNYHYHCFVQYVTNRKRNRMDIESANDMVESAKNENLKKKEKAKFFDYISNEYDIPFFPKYTFVKLNSIQNGTFKGLCCSISYSELNEMFFMMKNYLVKTRMKMESRGKKIDSGLDKFNYDLAIVLNNYGKYLKYKQESKKADLNKNKIKENIVQQNRIETTKRSITKIKKDSSSILDIVDEMF